MPSGPLDLSTSLAALYLSGGPRPFEPVRRQWPGVEHVLRSAPEDPDALARAGYRQEALLLADPQLCEWATYQVRTGTCMTAIHDLYPRRWLAALRHAAPPALWIAGKMPPGPFLSVVGSRKIAKKDALFATAVGREAVAQGYSVASGGASGCDTASMAEVGARGLELLPRGLCPADEGTGRCRLSTRPPGEDFTSAAAMERNALIYAISDRTVVVHARLNEGGTWSGARTALRRRLCTVLVRVRAGDPASRALIALGAIPIEHPEEVTAVQSPRGDRLPLPDGEP
jgi:predicted Rossmann fold nucleotide-binding protein DprA/Smf involved in DNA uptake